MAPEFPDCSQQGFLYVVSVHRLTTTMENRPVNLDNVHGKSPIYIFHEHQIYNMRKRPSANFVQLLRAV